MADAPTTAYTEVQIDDDSISLTFISESPEGVTIEDTERFTFEELQDMAGEHLTLRLSDDSRTALADSRESAVVGNLLQSENLEEAAEEMPDNPTGDELLAYMGLLGGGATDGEPTGEDPTGGTGGGSNLPEVGDIVLDGNPPSWSQDDRLEVVGVLADVSADEYIIESMDGSRVNSVAEKSDGHIGFHESTVADANPSYDEDDAVIIAQYADGNSGEYAFPAGRIEEWDAAGTTMTSAFE